MADAMRLITNNPEVVDRWKGDPRLEVEFLPGDDMREVLYRVRDLLHRGHRLLTHPLTGSLKPNENPYKSILVTERPTSLSLDHVAIMEQCIQATHNALNHRKIPAYSQHVRQDYMLIDSDLIANGILSASEQL
ncbi:MAG: GrdX family protein [Bacillota bacterium]|nr:GrdX family protein [Bacillota bacterium]MDW7677287.1 GrdX family protein [Bacillota bacterium]